MRLAISRQTNNAVQSTGELTRDGQHQCWTLEDPVRRDPNLSTPANEGKIYGRTAIPAGEYNTVITYSPKFKKDMILLENVPGYTGIRMHGGHDADDSLGCPLLGYEREASGHLLKTLEASRELLAIVKLARDRGDVVTTTVTNDFPEEDLQ